jgi:DNA mismatch endonuclease (patch repair protein)
MRDIIDPHGGSSDDIRSLLIEAGYQEVIEAHEAFTGPGYICAREYRWVALLHDCFWRGHSCDAGIRLPASSTDFWAQMADHRRRRSETAERELDRVGWKSMVVWLCETDDPAGLAARLQVFLK